MRIIGVTEDIVINPPKNVNGNGADPNVKPLTISFQEFVEASLDQYEPLGTGYKMAKRGRAISEAIDVMDETKESDNYVLRLEDEDFDIVKNAVNKAKFRPAANRRMVNFYEAVETAQEVKTGKQEKKG